MTLVVTLGDPPVLRPDAVERDRLAAEAAIERYEQAFHQIDGDVRAMRAEGWEGLDVVQRHAEIAWRAARDERRLLEGSTS